MAEKNPALSKIQARQWLFPLAALYAMLVLPVSVLAILGKLPVPALANPYAHAHEMLAGVAFLVICGYLLGNQSRSDVVWLIICWALARLAFWLLGFHPLVSAFAALAAAMLVWRVVPAFWRAKKWQNRSVAPIVSMVGISMSLAGSDISLFIRLLPTIFLVLAALMLFMGGRVIAPLLASFWLQHGQRMGNRVQPNVEGAGLLFLAVALPLELTNLLPQVAAVSLMLAGASVMLRIARWQPWLYVAKADISFLFVGYTGLALAIFFLGAGQFWPLAAKLSTHTLTVAALGMLMVSVMARVTQVKKFKDGNKLLSAQLACASLLLAAICRLAAVVFPASYMLLVQVAAFGWSLGFAALLWVLWRCRAQATD